MDGRRDPPCSRAGRETLTTKQLSFVTVTVKAEGELELRDSLTGLFTLNIWPISYTANVIISITFVQRGYTA